ncbi:MAG: hypothetical protein MJZ79_07910, partial [Paludibacteraceae bacterium]|nr:hypothetical protein [Paludibacteraceae bacterium]
LQVRQVHQEEGLRTRTKKRISVRFFLFFVEKSATLVIKNTFFLVMYCIYAKKVLPLQRQRLKNYKK